MTAARAASASRAPPSRGRARPRRVV